MKDVTDDDTTIYVDHCRVCPFAGCSSCEYQPEPIEGQGDLLEELDRSPQRARERLRPLAGQQSRALLRDCCNVEAWGRNKQTNILSGTNICASHALVDGGDDSEGVS